jgi:hypothetical protein
MLAVEVEEQVGQLQQQFLAVLVEVVLVHQLMEHLIH